MKFYQKSSDFHFCNTSAARRSFFFPKFKIFTFLHQRVCVEKSRSRPRGVAKINFALKTPARIKKKSRSHPAWESNFRFYTFLQWKTNNLLFFAPGGRQETIPVHSESWPPVGKFSNRGGECVCATQRNAQRCFGTRACIILLAMPIDQYFLRNRMCVARPAWFQDVVSSRHRAGSWERVKQRALESWIPPQGGGIHPAWDGSTRRANSAGDVQLNSLYTYIYIYILLLFRLTGPPL